MANYRLIRHELDNSIGVYEVSYDEGGSTLKQSVKLVIASESPENLKDEIEAILDAFNKPRLFMSLLDELRDDEQ
jgi:hypothetical protein